MRPGEILEVLREASATAKPAEGSLHYPPLRQDLEPEGVVGSLDDFERDASLVPDGVWRRRAIIAAIGDDLLACPRSFIQA